MSASFSQFRKQYKNIQKDKAVIARKRVRQRTKVDRDKLLTMAIIEDLAKKGDEYKYFYKGKEYTVSKKELIKSREKFKKKVTGKKATKGVTLRALLKHTDKATKERSKEKIRSGNFANMKSNVVTIFTGKSAGSKWKSAYHRVIIELKDYYYEAGESPENGYKKNAQRAIKGKVGVYCDCEDFQYRKNYWITQLGAYVSQAAEIAISRRLFRKKAISINPKETSFPKITNPSGKLGPLCIHIIKAKQVIEQPVTIALIAKQMIKDAESISPGEDPAEIRITEDDYDAYVKEKGDEKLKKMKTSWLDKSAEKAFKQFSKAGKAFQGFVSDMLSKEIKRRKSAETKLDRVIENVLRANNMNVKETVETLGVDKKDVKAVVKKIK